MNKRLALAAVVLGVGGVLAVAPASADPQLCLNLDVTVNDQNVAVDECLPPEGSEPPALPELPAPPAPPAL